MGFTVKGGSLWVILLVISLCSLVNGLNFDARSLAVRRDVQPLDIQDVLDDPLGPGVKQASVAWHSSRMAISANSHAGRGRVFILRQDEGTWKNVAVEFPSTEAKDWVASGVAVFGMWSFFGAYRPGHGGEVTAYYDGQKKQVVEADHSQFGQSLSASNRFLAVSSRELIQWYFRTKSGSLELSQQLPVSTVQHLGGFEDSGRVLGSVTSFGELEFGISWGIVALHSEVRILGMIFSRDASGWKPARVMKFPEIVSFPPWPFHTPERKDEPLPGEKEFKGSVAVSRTKAVLGCKNCQFRHSVLVASLNAGGVADIQELVVNDYFLYGLTPRRYGHSIAVTDKMLAVSDVSMQTRKVSIFSIEGPRSWNLLHWLYKPKSMNFRRPLLDIAADGDDLLSCAVIEGQDRKLSPLVYHNATTFSVADVGPGTGGREDQKPTDRFYVDDAELNTKTKISLGVLSSASAIFLSHAGLTVWRLVNHS
ncbi:hypothetical protein NDN08_003044 [Rhodosorus marinus]|uniref:ER membrane protein complex subunit 1 n=1 Tax=Rhodosorus marinus TaxID=101924 RepID=A0AAV8V173_9RHOD|nr:hypothetical protein NDN08_003044 [Rhodosorus marinus]